MNESIESFAEVMERLSGGTNELKKEIVKEFDDAIENSQFYTQTEEGQYEKIS